LQGFEKIHSPTQGVALGYVAYALQAKNTQNTKDIQNTKDTRNTKNFDA